MIEVNYNEYKETIAENMKLIRVNHELKERIDKAIEYIETHKYPTMYGFSNDDLDKNDLIKILQGSAK